MQKINMLLWLCYKKHNHNPQDKKGTKCSWQKNFEPEKAHPTGEFVIVAKFGDHALCCLTSSLSNVIGQAGRQARTQKFQLR